MLVKLTHGTNLIRKCTYRQLLYVRTIYYAGTSKISVNFMVKLSTGVNFAKIL